MEMLLQQKKKKKKQQRKLDYNITYGHNDYIKKGPKELIPVVTIARMNIFLCNKHP